MVKFKFKFAAGMAAAAALLCVAQASQAAIVNWTVNGVFDDGGTVGGSFTIDTTSDTVTSWLLGTTLGTTGFGGFVYSDTTGFAGDNAGNPGFFEYVGGPAGVGLFLNVPFAGSGVVTPLTGAEIGFIGPYPVIGRSIVDGTAVGTVAEVPEPATWAMTILGLGLVGAALRRRPQRALA